LSRLNDKVCVVTGAAAGIGYQTALAFASEGARVLAVDRDAKGLEALKIDGLNISTTALDVTDPAAVTAFFADIDDIDVLFNCAGMVTVGNLMSCSDQDWSRSLDLNVTSLFTMCRAAIPLMLASGGGSIINMASVISSIGAAPDRFAYGVSKAAVIGMTKSIALDYAAEGIRCNAICPSGVETPSMTARINAMDDPDAARFAFSSRQPVGRMGRPDEIAELATYLASDISAFMTGSAIPIDGGAKI
jgi:NAD(P)-dependent dehydrogenase (short-subunit alcohol dehydrogenase family)